ncbi:hypothetical protein JAAARDRAFT_29008 [Jaapia argillacea MUCL 33604]|uniref:Uncharacterized protein n=1 Tax=Jaapia argillacea MUCL 33604 TaxID=933084 RepID=A0A067QA33_9AGAM|nr:hypothetical protein JAAARDRAFT_29008 [Jaapia argillacea MUCL 33604]
MINVVDREGRQVSNSVISRSPMLPNAVPRDNDDPLMPNNLARFQLRPKPISTPSKVYMVGETPHLYCLNPL